MNDKISIVRSGLVVPQTKHTDFCSTGEFGRNKFIHGVVSANRKESFNHFVGGKPCFNQEERDKYLYCTPIDETLDGKWLYAGCLTTHFGHVLAECIHRLWAWDKLSHQVEGVIVLARPDMEDINKWPAYIHTFFELFNIPISKIKVVTKLTKVDIVYVPEQGSSLSSRIPNWYHNWVARLSPVVKKLSKKIEYKKVFVSRANYRIRGRLSGMTALENLLEKNGYYVFKPEEHPIIKQLEVINNAEKIIWEEGSAQHLLELLPRQKAKAFYLARRAAQRNLWVLCQCKYTSPVKYDHIINENITSIHKPLGTGMLLSSDDLFNALASNDFIENNSRHKSAFANMHLNCEKRDLTLFFNRRESDIETRNLVLSKYDQFVKLRKDKVNLNTPEAREYLNNLFGFPYDEYAANNFKRTIIEGANNTPSLIEG